MSGILFLRTGDLERTAAFYIARLDCRRWLDQPGCVILRHDNFLFGLCARERPQTDVLLTFFYDTPAEVDRLYARHRDTADGPPRLNETYRIYQFFARDPEGRGLEFQHFADPVAQFRSGDDLLATRRSVREFAPDPVPDDVIERIIESCRFAPSAWNRQPQCYRIIRDPETLRYLAASRQEATAPIGRAPAAVAVSVDTTVSPYPAVDGAIAAYHFLLAAWFYGLGTCWMGNMDAPEIKARLGLPPGHFLATVTPLGYPKERAAPPPARKPFAAFLRG